MFIYSLIITIILFLLTSVVSIYTLHKDDEKFINLMKILFYLSSISLIISGYIRFNLNSMDAFIQATRSHWGYFFLIILIMIAILAFLNFTKWKNQWKSIMPIAMPFLTILLLISTTAIKSQRAINVEIENNLLPIHIIVSTIGEILFFLSFAGSILYMALERQLKKKSSMKLIYKLPNLESIENFNKWTISRSFLALSIGLISGVIMVFMKYDKFFLVTPKEIGIYSSWAVILVLFYLRYKSDITSYKLSFWNVILFSLVLIIYILTLIFTKTGFHSYQ